MKSLVLVMALASQAAAGSIDANIGLQATKTSWPSDKGGGGTLSAGYWFAPWIGVSALFKEQYATIDDRILSYYSANVAAGFRIKTVRVIGTLGLVHQHEEPRAAIMEQPFASLLGVGDGIRHRLASRAGVTVEIPLHDVFYVALDVDATRFMDSDKGPPWMLSAGAGLGFVYDFASAK